MKILAAALVVTLAAPAWASPDSDAAAMLAQGEKFMKAKKYESAIAVFNAARALTPKRPIPHLWLGLAYAANGQCKEAIPELQQYLDLEPEDPSPEASRTLDGCKARQPAPPPEPAPAPASAAPPAGSVYDPFGGTTSSSAAPASGSAYGAPTYGAPTVNRYRSADRRRVEICNPDNERWAFCDHPKYNKTRFLTENEFIRRYHEVTGSSELDGRVEPKIRITRPGVLVVSALTLLFGAFQLSGFGFLGCSDYRYYAAQRDCYSSYAGIGSVGAIGAFFTAVIGYPLVFRESRTEHKLSEPDGRQRIEELNQALEKRVRISPAGVAVSF
jgi:tetratricopeptide (TPR) repeat protein